MIKDRISGTIAFSRKKGVMVAHTFVQIQSRKSGGAKPLHSLPLHSKVCFLNLFCVLLTSCIPNPPLLEAVLPGPVAFSSRQQAVQFVCGDFGFPGLTLTQKSGISVANTGG